MGELLLCREPIAAMPYYMEGLGINLYSMEELCYYIAGNTYLLDSSFMCEELCVWVEREMGLYKLAEQLRGIHSLPQYVGMILEETGYCSKKETEEIVQIVRQMAEKSEFECSKLRADRLMEKEKYISCIYEYKRLLDSGEAQGASALLLGAIWHNLGTAYVRLFLFEEAGQCYGKAYAMNHLAESEKAELSCLCMYDEVRFLQKAKEYHLDEAGVQEIRNAIALAGNGDAVYAVEERIRGIMEMEETGQKAEAKQEVSDMIFQWKEDYRRSCRM